MSIFTSVLSTPSPSFGVAAALTALAVARLHRRSGQAPLLAEQSAPSAAPLFEGARWLQSGQVGVTYSDLFAQHISGAAAIQVVDPWLRSFRQIRLFGEFLESVAPAPGERREVKLVTSLANDTEGWAMGQAKALLELKGRFEQVGVDLTVTFDDSIHDRWIQTGEWTILLGKGLDIWEAPGCYTSVQEQRVVSKQMAVTYLRSSGQAQSPVQASREVAR